MSADAFDFGARRAWTRRFKPRGEPVLKCGGGEKCATSPACPRTRKITLPLRARCAAFLSLLPSSPEAIPRPPFHLNSTALKLKMPQGSRNLNNLTPFLSEAEQQAQAQSLARAVYDWTVETSAVPVKEGTMLSNAIERIRANQVQEWDWEAVLNRLTTLLRKQPWEQPGVPAVPAADYWDSEIREFFNQCKFHHNIEPPYTAAAKTLLYLLVKFYSADENPTKAYPPEVIIQAILLLVSCFCHIGAGEHHMSDADLCMISLKWTLDARTQPALWRLTL